MAYGHLDIVCAPKKQGSEERFVRRLIRYGMIMAILCRLYRRGEISIETWYTAENAVANRYRLAENSIYRIWTPNSGTSFEEGRAERKLYMTK